MFTKSSSSTDSSADKTVGINKPTATTNAVNGKHSSARVHMV